MRHPGNGRSHIYNINRIPPSPVPSGFYSLQLVGYVGLVVNCQPLYMQTSVYRLCNACLGVSYMSHRQQIPPQENGNPRTGRVVELLLRAHVDECAVRVQESIPKGGANEHSDRFIRYLVIIESLLYLLLLYICTIMTLFATLQQLCVLAGILIQFNRIRKKIKW